MSKKRRTYGTGSLWLRGRIWWIRYHERVDGGSVQRYLSSDSDDPNVAKRLLRAKLAAAHGRRPTLVDPQRVTFESLRENYLARSVEKGLRSLKKVGTEERSLDTFARLDRFFGGWRAREISTAHIRRFRQEGKHDGLTDARLNRYVALLRAMFRQAAKDELITSAEMPAYFPMVREPNEARGAVFIKREWYKPLRRLLPEPLRSAFVLAYHTSVRVGEMERLRWRDLDLKQRLITLPGTATKTGQSRVIFLPRDFDRKPGKPDELVFPLGNYRRPWRKACVKVGAGRWEETTTGRKVYVGALLRHCRHTAIRNMVDSGLDRDRAKALSGHLTDSMFTRYNIGKEEDVKQAAQAIERFHQGR